MGRCWLKGAQGDAPNAVPCAAGYNLRWLLRAMVRLGLKATFLRSFLWALIALINGDHSRSNSTNRNFQLARALG